MKILVTGGGGLVGRGALPELLKAGHEVRLLGRGAERDARRWPGPVEAFVADVTDERSLRGAADGCDDVLHMAGIAEERPPAATFDRVNVDGTRNVLAEAERAGVFRFVHVSSLGVERGTSEYHRSRREAESVVRAARVEHVVVRPGIVYGPGDRLISKYLAMFRTLPIVPIIGARDEYFQPIFYRDLGRALVRAIEYSGVKGQVFDVVGDEQTTMDDLADRFQLITGRSPARVPVPEFLASLGDAIAKEVGASLPVADLKRRMLMEGAVVSSPEINALTFVFAVAPTPLGVGLRELADAIPEQPLNAGVGSLAYTRYWARIERSTKGAPELLDILRRRCKELMPIEIESGPRGPEEIALGTTLTTNVGRRDSVRLRVLESDERNVTLATIDGRPLVGVLRFASEQHGATVRFAIETYSRPATRLDYAALIAVGRHVPDAVFPRTIERIVELSGGDAPGGVERISRTLDDAEAAEVERWVGDLVAALPRDMREDEGLPGLVSSH